MNEITIGCCLLKPILETKGMTQQDLADITGISKQEINSYANDRRRMSLKTSKVIATALKINVDELYEWKIK